MCFVKVGDLEEISLEKLEELLLKLKDNTIKAEESSLLGNYKMYLVDALNNNNQPDKHDVIMKLQLILQYGINYEEAKAPVAQFWLKGVGEEIEQLFIENFYKFDIGISASHLFVNGNEEKAFGKIRKGTQLAKETQGIKDFFKGKTLVVGFITDGKRVLLINKNRPENQKGLFNGVGGAAQENETPLEAMVREAKEETGLEIKDWLEIDVFPYSNGITLYLYQATISCKEIEQFQSPTDEKVSLFDKDKLPENLVHDVAYIVESRLVKGKSNDKKNI